MRDNLSGTFPVPFDAAQAILPEGFTANVAAQSPAPTAVVFVVIAYCAYDHTVPFLFAAQPPELAAKVSALGLGRAGEGSFARTTTPAAVRCEVGVDGVTFELSAALAPNPATIQGGGFRIFGVTDHTLRSTLDGAVAGGSASSAVISLRSTGDPLLSQAQPAARGGAVTGYDIAFTLRA